MADLRVCVVGGGAREHALAAVLGRHAEVVVTPGNAGIPGSVTAPPEEIDADLFVVGPEAPLVDGLADRLAAGGKLVLGPRAAGARLEGSKAFMKEIAASAGVPTARYAAFDDADAASGFLRSLPPPYVVKTDGLAAGKGVLVTDSLADAEADVRAKLAGTAFGAAGRRVVIEEGLRGPELSVFALSDGTRAVPIGHARDFKRIGDGDTGANTGGMGAFSPVAGIDDDVVGDVMDRFVEPTLAALRERGIEYRGFLYVGLMLTAEGLKLIEYNVRFGDPEAQVVLPRLESDLAMLLGQAARGRIEDVPRFADDAAVTVVAATPGYPEDARPGQVIHGLAEAAEEPGVEVFCAAAEAADDGSLVTAGGRVLAVTGLGPTVAGARRRAYAGLSRISFEGMQYRTDIAEEERP
jgi:phosphoribosylamine--glycine ligase